MNRDVGADLPEGKKKKIGDEVTMASRNAVRNTIGASHIESGRALFHGCFGTTAAMSRPCRRSASAPHAIVLCNSLSSIQMVNCQYRMSVPVFHCTRYVINFEPCLALMATSNYFHLSSNDFRKERAFSW